MRARSPSWLIPLLLSLGCDQAESAGFDRHPEGDALGAVIADLIVDVTDRGSPVVADRVFAGNDEGEITEAECIVHAGPDRCKVWSLRFEAVGPITLFTELCGDRHAEPYALNLGLVEEPFVSGMSVTLQADGMGCPRALPEGCDGKEFAEPAVAIVAVDPHGRPVDVRDVWVHHDDEAPSPADCMEGTGGGCSEWASRQTVPGRYRASAALCGHTFVTGWATVAADALGCTLHRKALALVVNDAVCEYAN